MKTRLFMIFFILFICTGCADTKEIENQAYAVGIGIDYTDDNYQVTLQFLDFSNVAKTEGKSDKPGQVWLGTGEGKTVEEAIFKIYRGIQIPINFDQISLFIFGQSLLEKGLKKTILSLDTNFSIRLTGMAYGTGKSIEDIFTASVPFNYPYTNSRIVQPDYLQGEASTIPSVTLQELVYQLNEKATTVMLPSVSINKEIINKDLEKTPVTIINGSYLLKQNQLKGFLTTDDLKGFIYVNDDSIRTSVVVSDDEQDEKHVQVDLKKPNLKKHIVKTKDNSIKLQLDITISAIIRESSYQLDMREIKRKLEEKLKTEAYNSYIKGLELDSDIYQFEEFMYRFKHHEWKKLSKSVSFPKLKKENIHITIKPYKSIHKNNSNINTH
jgi:spore germination protein KC